MSGRKSPYDEIPEGIVWPDTVDESGEADFSEYWIYSVDEKGTILALLGVLKMLVYRWKPEDRIWEKSAGLSLAEMGGHGGSTDFWRVSEAAAQRLKALWREERPVLIDDIRSSGSEAPTPEQSPSSGAESTKGKRVRFFIEPSKSDQEIADAINSIAERAREGQGSQPDEDS